MKAGAPVTAAYARVSTSHQETDDQASRLRKAAIARWPGDRVVVYEEKISGVLDNRPRLDEIRAGIGNGSIRRVLVSKIDRLGRSVGMILRFWDEADAAGVPVVVVDQGIDTSTPAGRLQRTLLAALAEFERELILERTAAGIARARARGVKFGRPLTLTPRQQRKIRELKRRGVSHRQIARVVVAPRRKVDRFVARGFK